jgi:hypothetical protein
VVLVRVLLYQAACIDPEVLQAIALHLEKPDLVITLFTHGSSIDPVTVGDFLTLSPGMREYCVRRNIVSAAKPLGEEELAVGGDLQEAHRVGRGLGTVCGKLGANESKMSAAGGWTSRIARVLVRISDEIVVAVEENVSIQICGGVIDEGENDRVGLSVKKAEEDS